MNLDQKIQQRVQQMLGEKDVLIARLICELEQTQIDLANTQNELAEAKASEDLVPELQDILRDGRPAEKNGKH